MKRPIIPIVFLFLMMMVSACHPVKEKTQASSDTLTFTTNAGGNGPSIELLFIKGPEHNHPLMAVWAEDTNHNYLYTLYVSKSVATGIYPRKQTNSGAWEPGEQRRPAALPIWSHAYGYVSADGLYLPDAAHPVPDAYTGATPQGNFLLQATSDGGKPEILDLYFEINQSWDWNETYHNNAFPGDDAYASSAQPSLLYHVRITMKAGNGPYEMKVAGHGHPSGKDGTVYSDLNTLTTSLQIVKKISIQIK